MVESKPWARSSRLRAWASMSPSASLIRALAVSQPRQPQPGPAALGVDKRTAASSSPWARVARFGGHSDLGARSWLYGHGFRNRIGVFCARIRKRFGAGLGSNVRGPPRDRRDARSTPSPCFGDRLWNPTRAASSRTSRNRRAFPSPAGCCRGKKKRSSEEPCGTAGV